MKYWPHSKTSQSSKYSIVRWTLSSSLWSSNNPRYGSNEYWLLMIHWYSCVSTNTDLPSLCRQFSNDIQLLFLILDIKVTDSQLSLPISCNFWLKWLKHFLLNFVEVQLITDPILEIYTDCINLEQSSTFLSVIMHHNNKELLLHNLKCDMGDWARGTDIYDLDWHQTMTHNNTDLWDLWQQKY